MIALNKQPRLISRAASPYSNAGSRNCCRVHDIEHDLSSARSGESFHGRVACFVDLCVLIVNAFVHKRFGHVLFCVTGAEQILSRTRDGGPHIVSALPDNV